MDKILHGYLNDFSKEYEFTHLSDDLIFENFINYCIVSKNYPGSFELDTISVDDGGQLGIDGIAIIVNDHLVTAIEEVEDIIRIYGRLNVDFVFIQSKTSAKFDMGAISKFFTATEQFFVQDCYVTFSEKAQNLRVIQEYIYSQSIKMESAPNCYMYYATTGEWKDDKNITGLADSVVDRLIKTNSFTNVSFIPLDSDKIKHLYRNIKNKIVKEIEFDKYIVLPKIDGIQESFIGIIPCKEFLKLICDEEGNLQKNLFYDNVRDFQGYNQVNTEISQTLSGAPEFRDKFVVLNNGITIVAKALTKISATFKLIDYQIVNGCQTSHIIYLNRKELLDNVYLPVKIIVTTNIDVTNAVIKATNRQTLVNIEAFESLRVFHKELEAFYSSFDENHRLFYERRSKQYDNDPKIRKNRIISLANQIICFISMFLLEPHSTHRYYGELLNVYRGDKKQLFMDEHELYPYYVSGYALHILDSFFNLSKIDAKYKKAKFQMLMLFRIKVGGIDLPKLSDKKRINDYCVKMQEVLWDNNKSLKIFLDITRLIDLALEKTDLKLYDRKRYNDATRRRNFTSELISLIALNTDSKNILDGQRQKGTVKWFDSDKGYGFIETETGHDLFVHYSAIWGSGFKTLNEYQKVEFTVIESTKGLQAKDVEILIP